MLNLLEKVLLGGTEAARREQTRLSEKLAALQQKKETLRTEISEIETSAESLADLEDVAGYSGELSLRQTELHLIDRLIEATEGKMRAAGLDLKRAEAQNMLAQAAGKREQIAELAEKTAPLLKKLQEIEGVEFDTSILSAQRSDRGWSPIGRGVASLPMHLRSPAEVSGNRVSADFQRTRSRQLLEEAIHLEKKAREILLTLPPRED